MPAFALSGISGARPSPVSRVSSRLRIGSRGGASSRSGVLELPAPGRSCGGLSRTALQSRSKTPGGLIRPRLHKVIEAFSRNSDRSCCRRLTIPPGDEDAALRLSRAHALLGRRGAAPGSRGSLWPERPRRDRGHRPHRQPGQWPRPDRARDPPLSESRDLEAVFRRAAPGGRACLEDLRDARDSRRGNDSQHDQSRHVRPHSRARIERFSLGRRGSGRVATRDPRAGRRLGCLPSPRDERVLREHVLPLEPAPDPRAVRRSVGSGLPLGPLPGRLAREAPAHRQQRLPSSGASLRLEDALKGGEDGGGRPGRVEESRGHRRPSADAGVGRGGDRVTIAIACLLLLALSVAVYAAGLGSLAVLRRDRRGARLPGFFPPVSIVKPLSGLDDELDRNLESFYRLDYPSYEIVFSFARRSDPAFSVARQVAGRHPEISSVFVVDAREPGGNSKVSRLCAGIRRARFRHILMADGNVRVHREFLARAISFFANPSVGLVSHLFRARGARTIGSRLESLHLNGALRAGTAALSGILGLPCVVGKSILVSREALNAIGGIESLRDHPAEDYLLEKMVAKAGFRVVLSADEIGTAEVSRSLAAAWSRQRRWTILRKRLGGLVYTGELLANPLPWLAGVAVAARGEAALVAAGAGLYLLRVALEGARAARSRGAFSFSDWLPVPVRDAAAAALFVAGLFGSRTTWRGRVLRVGRNTRIEQPPDPSTPFAGPAGRPPGGVRSLS